MPNFTPTKFWRKSTDEIGMRARYISWCVRQTMQWTNVSTENLVFKAFICIVHDGIAAANQSWQWSEANFLFLDQNTANVFHSIHASFVFTYWMTKGVKRICLLFIRFICKWILQRIQKTFETFVCRISFFSLVSFRIKHLLHIWKYHHLFLFLGDCTDCVLCRE